jgi:formamidopyrimidine-DNA glycosylase
VPEILEVETARVLLDARALDREIATVHAPDAWFLKRGLTPSGVRAALRGQSFTGARRRGKLLLMDVSSAGSVPERRAGSVPERRAGSVPERKGSVLGLHLGMSGRVLVDDEAAGDPLLYASNRADPAWHRFGLGFADGGSMYLRDPRRLGAVELDPDEERLGPDAFALTLAQLRAVVGRSRAPVKAVIMDQSRIAGLGNLLCDEALWRAGIDPARAADTLDDAEVRRLHRAIRDTLRILGRRGGSHTGDLTAYRGPGLHCSKDGAPLQRRTVGGRTTYSCPLHQR